MNESGVERWKIEIQNFDQFTRALGGDVLAAFCRCFVHADRLTSLISCAYLSQERYGQESVPFSRNLHTTVWFTIGTLRELSMAIGDVRAALAKRGRFDREHESWVRLREFERRWAADELAARLRNKAAFHVDVEVIMNGLAAIGAANRDTVLSRGEGRKAERSSLTLGLESMFNGLGIDIAAYGNFLGRVADDQGIGSVVQEAFMHAVEQVGIPIGPSR